VIYENRSQKDYSTPFKLAVIREIELDITHLGYLLNSINTQLQLPIRNFQWGMMCQILVIDHVYLEH
jgi:hypothetical protein